VSQEELHPEEGLVPPVGQEEWLSLLNEDGQLEDDLALRKVLLRWKYSSDLWLSINSAEAANES
jgi:hypothetical protein